MKRCIHNNIKSFIISIFIFSAINILAVTIRSEDIIYQNNISVKDAVDDLYISKYKIENWIDPDFISAYISNSYDTPVYFKYWNYNFAAGSSSRFDNNSIPTDTGLYGTYESRAALASAYSYFQNNPYYIKSSLVSDTRALGHSVCLYYNNHEFCMIPMYGKNLSVSEITKKLKNEMMLSLKTNSITCSTDTNSNVTCSVGNHYCKVENNGYISSCGGSSNYCMVEGNLSSAPAFCARKT